MLLLWTATASATLIKSYDFNGSLADTLGNGAAMTSLGGSLATAGRYTFGPNQGLNLTNALADTADYTIEMKFQMTDDPGFWKKIIDYQDLAIDEGVYISGNDGSNFLTYYNDGDDGTTPVPLNTDVIVTVSRDGATGVLTGKLNGILQWSFVDDFSDARPGDDFSDAVPGTNTLNFFVDDHATGQGEFFSGSVDYIRIFGNAATEFVWSGNCGTGLWHSGCNTDETNWEGPGSEMIATPPGDGGGNVTISGAAVVLNGTPLGKTTTSIDTLSATGSLAVNAPLALAGASSIQALTLNGDLSTESVLTLSGNSAWQGGVISGETAAVASGVSKLVIAPMGVLEISAGDKILNTNLVVMADGVVTQADGTLTIGNGAHLEVRANGGFVTEGGLISSVEAIRNAGAFTKSKILGGVDTLTVIDAPFVNDGGSIVVGSGTLAFRDRNEMNGGSHSVAAGAKLLFFDNTTEVTGLLEAIGDGDLVLKDGFYTVNSGATARFSLRGDSGFLLDGVVLDAEGTVQNTKNMTFMEGSINGGSVSGGVVTGGVENATGATLKIVQSSGTRTLGGVLVNNGSIEHQANTVLVVDGGRIIHEGGEYSLTDNSVIESGATPGVFDNSGGTVRVKTADEPSKGAEIGTAFNFSNGGKLILERGFLEVTGAGSHQGSGSFEIIGGVLGDGALTGRVRFTETQSFDGDFQISGTGRMDFENAVTVSSGSVTANMGGETAAVRLGAHETGNASINAALGTFVNKGKLEFLTGTLTGGSVTATGSNNGFQNQGGALNIGRDFFTSGKTRNITNGALRNYDGGTVTQFEDLNLSNGIILNDTGGTYEIQRGDIVSLAGSNAFRNRGGTLMKTTSSKVVIESEFNMTGGTVDIQAGRLTFGGASTHEGAGNFMVGEGAVLDFAVGLGDISLFKGDYRIEGTGIALVRGNLVSEANLVVNLTGPGKFLINGIETGGFNVAGAVVTNEGNAEWRGGGLSEFSNDTDGMFAITHADASPEKVLLANFTNKGTVNHAAEAVVKFETVGDGSARIVNEGTYNLRGTLIGNGANHKIENRDGATFRVDAAGATRSFGGAFDNKGTVVAAANTTFELLTEPTQLDVGLLFNVLRGGTWVAEGGAKIQLGSDNAQIFRSDGTVIMRDDGRITNLSDADAGGTGDFLNSGTFELRGATTFRTGGDFQNGGDLGTIGLLVIDPGSTLIVNGNFETNSGSVNIINGILTATGNFENDGGKFKGSGLVNAANYNNISGLINPGNSPGTLTINGNYNQGVAATLLIEIAGALAGEFDVLDVTGDVTLAGALEFLFLDSFLPGPDDLFPFLTVGGDLTGKFDTITVSGLGQGATYELLFLGGALTLANVIPGGAQQVPEPATAILFVFGLAGIGFMRRRQRAA